MTTCINVQPTAACLQRADGTRINVYVHFAYGRNANNLVILESVRVTDALGDIVPYNSAQDTLTPGHCVAISLTPNPVHWCEPKVNAQTFKPFVFDFPVVPVATSVNSVNDTYVHVVIDQSTGIAYNTDMTPFTGASTIPVLWLNIQPLLDQILIASGNLPGMLRVDSIADQPLLWVDSSLDPNKFTFYLGTFVPMQYTDKREANVPYPDTLAFPWAELVCVERKFWHNTSNAALFSVTDLLGNALAIPGNVTPKEGPCPQVKTMSEDYCVELTDGTVLTATNETVTSACGQTTHQWLDARVVPKIPLVGTILNILGLGQCECCDDSPQLRYTGPYQVALTYGNGFTGQNTAVNKFADAPVRWQVKVFKNGLEVFASPQSPALSSLAVGETWLRANTGGYLNILSPTLVTGPGSNYSIELPANSFGTFLVVIYETVDTTASPAAANYSAQVSYSWSNDTALHGGPNLADGLSNGSHITPATAALSTAWQLL